MSVNSFEPDSDEDVWPSPVPIVSSLVVASCYSAWCVEECCAHGEECDLQFSVHIDQCFQLSDNPFLDVSVNVLRKELPMIAAGARVQWLESR